MEGMSSEFIFNNKIYRILRNLSECCRTIVLTVWVCMPLPQAAVENTTSMFASPNFIFPVIPGEYGHFAHHYQKFSPWQRARIIACLTSVRHSSDRTVLTGTVNQRGGLFPGSCSCTVARQFSRSTPVQYRTCKHNYRLQHSIACCCTHIFVTGDLVHVWP